jgi:hypothetical protein
MRSLFHRVGNGLTAIAALIVGVEVVSATLPIQPIKTSLAQLASTNPPPVAYRPDTPPAPSQPEPEDMPVAKTPVLTRSELDQERYTSYHQAPTVPICTPDRHAMLRYWQMDLIKARHLSRIASPSCIKKTLGDTYTPLMTAVRSGVNPYGNMEVPESYAKVIRTRYARECGPNGCSLPE